MKTSPMECGGRAERRHRFGNAHQESGLALRFPPQSMASPWVDTFWAIDLSVWFRVLLTSILLLVTSLCSPGQTLELHSFTNVNRIIPDGNASGMSDHRILTSLVARLLAVRVKLLVAGTFNGDLYGYVRQVNASHTNLCVLLNRPGRAAIKPDGYNDQGFEVTFDDVAANGNIHNYLMVTNVPFGSPLAGDWRPDGRTNDPNAVLDIQIPATSLNSFSGGDAGGEWTLFLADVDSGGTNTLMGWTIELAGTMAPVVSWAAPSAITYGTALGGIQLNATSSVAGAFSYVPAAGAILHAGVGQALTCIFTPTDTANYNSVTGYVNIDVLQHALTITADDKSKFQGEPLPVFTATSSGFVNGDDASDLAPPTTFGCAATAASGAGTYGIAPGAARSPDYQIAFVNGTLTVNQVLEPVPDQRAYVLMSLILTNQVINTNMLAYPLTFGLGTGAPIGARVRTNGVFYWTPARSQARSTNVVSVWMTDSGSPRVHATNTFTIVVDDYLELFLGQSVLRAGQMGSVPVKLATTVGLTSLQALVQVPEDRLTLLALTRWAPEIGNAILQRQGTNVWQMNFTAAPGQALQGTQELASLSFLAVTNRSAFVPLITEVSTNLTTNGLTVWRTLIDNGRGVVIERESLVEALAPTNGMPDLMLYGIPGASYKILYAPGLTATEWQPVWSGTMPTNLSMQVSGLTNTGPAMFFRAQENEGP